MQARILIRMTWKFRPFAFYHAMHYRPSAKRGIAIAYRPSVCPSATSVDQDHTGLGWKYWNLIARTIGPTPSLFVAQRSSTYSQGNIGLWGNLGRL